MRALDMVEHLVGMQAQEPLNPYLGLWSRIDRFDPQELSKLLLDREVVRVVAMRGTLHLVTADDCLVLRPLVQPVLEQELGRHRDYAPVLRGLDLEPALAVARQILEQRPRSGPELRAALHEQFPALDAAALAYAARNYLPLVQVPPRGVWGRTGQVVTTTAESYLGRPLARKPSIDDVVLRYIAAFGPASVADVSAWSRLTGMREVVDRLRPRLRPFVDERGRELFDLPDAPRPSRDTPAPPRFLPEYDNVLLSHADRSRFLPEERRKQLSAGDRTVRGSVLHDGSVIGTWRIDTNRGADASVLVIDHVVTPTRRAVAALTAEPRRLLRFLELPAENAEVRFAVLG